VYTDEQLYYCDETGMYSILLPNKSLDLDNALSKVGTKTKKERVALLMRSCNAGRHKLKPVYVGKFRNPHCFKHVNMKFLPVMYTTVPVLGWHVIFVPPSLKVNLHH
jgi:hypothetical protein